MYVLVLGSSLDVDAPEEKALWSGMEGTGASVLSDVCQLYCDMIALPHHFMIDLCVNLAP